MQLQLSRFACRKNLGRQVVSTHYTYIKHVKRLTIDFVSIHTLQWNWSHFATSNILLDNDNNTSLFISFSMGKYVKLNVLKKNSDDNNNNNSEVEEITWERSSERQHMKKIVRV